MEDIINDPFLPTSYITNDRKITDRGLRKQISKGRFPAPDLKIGCRNFWRASTYRTWKTDALLGKFARVSQIGQRAPTRGTQKVSP